jgi:predicted small lipoprotein YifL
MKPTKIIMVLLLLTALLSLLALASCGKSGKTVDTVPNQNVSDDTSTKVKQDDNAGYMEYDGGEEGNDASISELEEQISEIDQLIRSLQDSLITARGEIRTLTEKTKKNANWVPLLIAVIALGFMYLLLRISLNDLKDKLSGDLKDISHKIKKFEGSEMPYSPKYSHGVQVTSKNDDPMNRGMLEDIRRRLEVITRANEDSITKEHLNGIITNIYRDFKQKMDLTLKEEIEASQHQTLGFITELERDISNLSQDIRGSHTLSEKILARVDAANDDRFLRLRLYFRDVSGDLQKAFLAAEKTDPDFQGSLREYVENFSKLVNLQQLSSVPNELSKAYEALRDIFKGKTIVWTFPKTGDDFDPISMEQHKRVGDQERVDSVLVPGFEVGEIKRKALVDVG